MFYGLVSVATGAGCMFKKTGNWPANKHELISKHFKSFLLFTKPINFDLL
jgi:hypothetical protein